MQIHPAIGRTLPMSNGDYVTILSQNSHGDLLGITRDARLKVRIEFPVPVVIALTSDRELGECESLAALRHPDGRGSDYCTLWWCGFQHGYDHVDDPPNGSPSYETFVYWNGFRCGVAMRDEAQKSGHVMKNNSRDLEY